jgi:hypothetical protein
VDLHATTHRGAPELTGARTLIKGLFMLCHVAAPAAVCSQGKEGEEDVCRYFDER